MRKIPGPAGAELEHLIDIERNLPDGSLQDRAIAQALAEAEIKRTGTTARDPANVLNPEETVRTLGTGHLDETAGILALTSRRLVFLPQTDQKPDSSSVPTWPQSRPFPSAKK